MRRCDWLVALGLLLVQTPMTGAVPALPAVLYIALWAGLAQPKWSCVVVMAAVAAAALFPVLRPPCVLSALGWLGLFASGETGAPTQSKLITFLHGLWVVQTATPLNQRNPN